MYCIKCGNQLPEGSTFCNKCGANQKPIQNQQNQVIQPSYNFQSNNNENNKNKLIIIISSIVVAVCLITIAIVLILNHKNNNDSKSTTTEETKTTTEITTTEEQTTEESVGEHILNNAPKNHSDYKIIEDYSDFKNYDENSYITFSGTVAYIEKEDGVTGFVVEIDGNYAFAGSLDDSINIDVNENDYLTVYGCVYDFEPFDIDGETKDIPVVIAVDLEKIESENFDYDSYTKEDFRTDITYDNLARTPDDYYGENFKMSGKIVQVIEGDEETHYRVAINNNYDDIVYLMIESKILDERLLEDDRITFYAISCGLTTYESTLGGYITIPQAIGVIVERN